MKFYEKIYDKIPLGISYFLRITIVIAIFGAIYTKSWNVLFISVLTLLLTFLPSILERSFVVSLPAEIEFISVLFIYASIFLGEVHGYYLKFWWWDILLHVLSGIMLGLIGFIILYVLYWKNKLMTNQFLIVLFAFCFAVALGTLWEIFEYAMDLFFNFSMQGTGLVDTMGDLILNSMGAILICVLGYLYIKYNKGFIIERIIKDVKQKNPQLFMSK